MVSGHDHSDYGRLVVTGIRGSHATDPLLRADLQACRQAGVGGVILFDVDAPRLASDPERDPLRAPRNVQSPDQLRELVAHVRAELGPETWVSVDQEGGAVARMSPRYGFDAAPSAAELATMPADHRAAVAARQAGQLAALGFDLNFAPCVDLAINPDSPLLAGRGRTFAADAETVIDRARVILDAHQRAGVAACLKHFPGHGSSTGDTHQGAVDITGTWQREPELAPYRALAHRDGVAVMVAHVMHRELDPALPASVSPRVIDGLLRAELGFAGVVVTDAIDMRAIADHFTPGAAAVAAVQAGADLVVDGFNLRERTEHPAQELVAALAAGVSRSRLHTSLARLERLRDQLRAG